MASSVPPIVFSSTRSLAARRRMLALQQRPEAPRYVIDDMAEDLLDRLAFVRHTPARTLVIGDWTGTLPSSLPGEITQVEPGHGFDQEHPFPFAGFDLIASLGTLDTANDLPGALIHLRTALAPGGLMLASLVGAGSLPGMRAAMLAADGERPAPRLHPQVDVRAGAQLLQRAGFADPVADTRTLSVRFSSLDRLVADLRAQGLSNVLARPGPPLSRTQAAIARESFGKRTTEQFEILTLSGWKR